MIDRKIDPRRIIDFLCQISYELALLLFVLFAILGPIHVLNTKHFNIDRTIDDGRVVFYVDSNTNLQQGDMLPIYRFHNGWKSEIGKIKVDEKYLNEVRASFDPKSFIWPMGRHGRVTVSDGLSVIVDIGSSLGLSKNDQLILFDGREMVGSIKLVGVFEKYSLGEVLESSVESFKGLTVSEYTVATQAVFLNSRLVYWGEILSFLIFIFGYFMYWSVYKKSPFEILGAAIKKIAKYFSGDSVYFLINLLLAVPFIWFLVSLFVYLIPYLVNSSQWLLGINVVYLDQYLLFGVRPHFYFILGVWYLWLLFTRKISPIIIFWNYLSYGNRKNKSTKGRFRNLYIWLLNLIVVYAHAASLAYFFSGNLGAMFNIGWKDSGVNFAGGLSFLSASSSIVWLASFWKVALYAITHQPNFVSTIAVFEFLRYLLWSVTIIGVFVGYGHSLISFLWGKHIRNVDFTITSWLINGFNYPLFEIVIWQMMPSLSGIDPTIVDGPLFYFMLSLELFLNILYALSIFNLGKMFGVMVDKGVKTTGFYSVVRHPSYTLESLMFIVLNSSGLSTIKQLLAASVFIFTYYIRSERDDDFMVHSNPDYTPYRKEVLYKFIPGVY